MIDKLTLTFNRTRQAVITKELIEIISGAAALWVPVKTWNRSGCNIMECVCVLLHAGEQGKLGHAGRNTEGKAIHGMSLEFSSLCSSTNKCEVWQAWFGQIKFKTLVE